MNQSPSRQFASFLGVGLMLAAVPDAGFAQARPYAPPIVPSVVQTIPSPAVTGQPVVVGQPFVLPGHPAPAGVPVTYPGQPIPFGRPTLVLQPPAPPPPPPISGSPYPSTATQLFAPPATPPRPAARIPDPAVVVPPAVTNTQMALRIVDVHPGPAATAGFKPGDILLRVDSLRTRTYDDIRNALKASTGTSVIEYYRPSTGVRGVKELKVTESRIGISAELVPIILNDPVSAP